MHAHRRAQPPSVSTGASSSSVARSASNRARFSSIGRSPSARSSTSRANAYTAAIARRFSAGKHHDPVREVLRPLPRDALNLGVRLLDRERAHRTSVSAASRARRARDGFGRWVKMSQPASSSASSAASPPRAKSPTARPRRPPIRARSVSPCAQQRRCALGLETEQRAQLVARTVELRIAEALPVLGREVHAPELEVTRHVLEEVDELQPGADGVARGDELVVVEPAQHAEHEPPARIGGVDAVLLQCRPTSRSPRRAGRSDSPRSAAGRAHVEGRTPARSAARSASPARWARPRR